MTDRKLSQIAVAESAPALTDTVVGVASGTTDNQFTLAQVQATVRPRVVAAGLTASAVQNAAGGTPIITDWAEFDTVAHDNDAATLPPAVPGLEITVYNSAVLAMEIFAATEALGGQVGGDTIAKLASVVLGGAGGLGTASTAVFRCVLLGDWSITLPITGPTGPTGDIGSTGATGPTGPTGDIGPLA